MLCLPISPDVRADEGGVQTPSPGVKPEKLSLVMGQSGIGRYRPGRWGLVTGQISNSGDEAATSLSVVTPSGSAGLQFARQITVPGNVSFASNWPVYVMNAEATGGVEFKYLFFPDGQDDGVIRRRDYDIDLPSFSGMTQRDLLPLCGLVGSTAPDRELDMPVHALMGVMRYNSVGNKSVTTLSAASITSSPECLDAMDQIAVTDSSLTSFPQACDALRTWVLRGGRLMIAAERTGPDAVEALLGDALPMTFVGETTTNAVTLDINPDYSKSQFAVRSVVREYPEPIHYYRVVAETCEPIWTVDGWPVAVAKNIGRGSVLVTTISTQVFYTPVSTKDETSPNYALIDSCRRIPEVMFTARPDPVIDEATAADQAAAQIGYRIPSRSVALVLLSIFPVGMLIAGIILLKRASGERLIVAVPAIAIITALPAAFVGFQIRSVAPATLIESVVVHSSQGFTELPADGFTSVFVPSPRELDITSENGTRLDALTDSTNSDYRRMIWHGPGDVRWVNLLQPAGLRTYAMDSVRHIKKPWRAVATLNENGISGSLPFGKDIIPADAFIAGMNRENLALNLSDEGRFQGTPDDALLAGQYFRSTLLSDDQRYRAGLLNSVFGNLTRAENSVFPAELSVVFWDESESEVLHLQGDDVRRQRKVLVVHPLEILPPEAGKPFLIPPQLLSYRSVINSEGGTASCYANLKRQWLPQESASKALLEFQIPKACLPFAADSGELQLLIRAGSRFVTIRSGDRENLQSIAELTSPLGMQKISIPGDLIQATGREGRVFLQIEVSELDSEMQSQDMTGEQDDSWRIERVLLSLKGQRKPD